MKYHVYNFLELGPQSHHKNFSHNEKNTRLFTVECKQGEVQRWKLERTGGSRRSRCGGAAMAGGFRWSGAAALSRRAAPERTEIMRRCGAVRCGQKATDGAAMLLLRGARWCGCWSGLVWLENAEMALHEGQSKNWGKNLLGFLIKLSSFC